MVVTFCEVIKTKTVRRGEGKLPSKTANISNERNQRIQNFLQAKSA